MLSALFRWWRFAQAVVGRVTTPRTDLAQSDRAFETQLRGSGGVDALHRVVVCFDRAAGTSRVMLAVGVARREWYAASRGARVSAIGLMIGAASAIALILEAIGPAGLGHFAWLLPALSLAAGVMVIVAAGPIARALDRAGS
jgi:hypothetical protein